MKAKKPAKKDNSKPLKANTTMKIDASFEEAMKALLKPKKKIGK